MRLHLIPLFVTLVVLKATAAPDNRVYPHPVETREMPGAARPQAELEPVQRTEVLEHPDSASAFHVSDSSVNFAVGSIDGAMNKDHLLQSATVFMVQKSWYSLDETAQELGLLYTDNNLFGVDWGFKKLCCFAYPGSPYYKLGLAGLFEPKDQFGNLIDYQRYFFQASVGFENLFSSRHRLRLELGARSGYAGNHLFIQFLMAFPD